MWITVSIGLRDCRTMKLYLFNITTTTVIALTHPHCRDLMATINNQMTQCWGCRNNQRKLQHHLKTMFPLRKQYACECNENFFDHQQCQSFRHYFEAPESKVYPNRRRRVNWLNFIVINRTVNFNSLLGFYWRILERRKSGIKSYFWSSFNGFSHFFSV